VVVHWVARLSANSSDYNADGSAVDVPNVPSFGAHLGGKHKADFLNGVFGPPATAGSLFPAPALGQEGDLGRNTYDNLGYNNMNLTVDKFFSTPWFFSEKMKIEVKGEIINLFNRSNLTTSQITWRRQLWAGNRSIVCTLLPTPPARQLLGVLLRQRPGMRGPRCLAFGAEYLS